MTKSEYMSNVYVGKHEKHTYLIGLKINKNSDVMYHIAYGMEELNNWIDNSYDWSIYDVTTGEILRASTNIPLNIPLRKEISV